MDKWGISRIIRFFSGFFQVVFVWCASHYWCGVCHIHDSAVIHKFMIYCSCSTNERNGHMFITEQIHNSDCCNIAEISPDGCNRIGVKNFTTGLTASLEMVHGYGVNDDIVSLYDNKYNYLVSRKVFSDLTPYDRFQLIGELEDMTK